ncbi:thiamine-phosphate synthase-like [Ylistrum balloti]|uniref:thiamine-phosphate synthase-like n=1 Tax=Ylistrum balloti TaxID=509963 RepID=UPI002905BC0F|nr:thiamine-phosphate synthase-like [Ylistrum balloti]
MFQLRAKGAKTLDLQYWLEDARQVLGDACLTINDLPSLALGNCVDGVHLGPDDMLPQTARLHIGYQKIIGLSGDDALRLAGPVAQQADYFGVGTFRQTATKPNAGKPIGLKGLKKAVTLTKKPIFAIGGIVPADAGAIRSTGAFGMAIYSAIWSAPDPIQVAKEFIHNWQQAS